MKRAALITFLALLVRLPFLAQGPGGWDDVDFALGLQEYDLAAMQPHFPGYPIYMLVAFLFGSLTDNPFLALSALSAVAASLTVFPLYSISLRCGGKRVADAACLLWAVAPLSVVLGTQPLSDSFGTLLATLLVASSLRALDGTLGERRRALALLVSGILLGLLYGVRVSYIMLGAVPLWAGYVYGRDTKRWMDVANAAFGAALVSLLWVYAMAVNVGSMQGLWELARAFTGGHFSDWGGAYTGGNIMERFGYWMLRQWLAAGLGAPWPGQHWISLGVLVLLPVALVGWWMVQKKVRRTARTRWREAGLFFMWIVPYFWWAFFAQNVEKPRHIFPLLVPLLQGLAFGFLSWRRAGRVFLLAFAACMAAVSWTQIHDQRTQASPMVQLADYAALHLPASGVVYTYEEERVMRYRHPSLQVVRLRSWPVFQTSVLSLRAQPESVFMTDAVLEGFHKPILRQYVRERARFTGNPWLYPTYHRIILYEIRPDRKVEWRNCIRNG
ncbi:glycosyltransferase family 39 protein [Aneurinibacillus thermoaerophilus]|uniref:glycosyltransferase family 39 protein n=1 Tax=Aneurinibacillus thermoaerophilus TaxID=143495 RepID=UPI002E24B8E6|nr:glycosyltransferase family 39 protein [Aneurinibacillus thermoaerophilus]MED0763673.1 glycosyltransferase family 39 protein [Aneurinibacillus thermoaerophilus]